MGFPIVDTKEKGRLSTRKEREDAERYDDENWQNMILQEQIHLH